MKSTTALETAMDRQDVRVETQTASLDRGPLAWFQAVSAFCLMFNSWGFVNSFGAFQAYYHTTLLSDRTASEISWIGSFQTFLLMFGAVLTGPLFDKGYLRPLILAGSFFIVFGMMMTSICHKYWQIMLSQGLVVGLGYACFMIPSVAVVPQYFKKHRALALGIGVSGGSLGGIIYTIIFQQLVPSIGFGWAVRTMSFLSLVTLIVPILTMKWKKDPSRPPGDFSAIGWKEIPFMAYVASSFFGCIGLYIPFFYVQLYALSGHSVSERLSPYLLPIMNAGSLFGRLLPPYLADKLGALNVASLCTLGAAITSFGWIRVSTEAEIVVFSLFFGILSGAFLALGPAIVASLMPDLSLFGVHMAILFFPSSIGVLIGNPIAGVLSRNSWIALQIFCGSTLLVSWLLMNFAKIRVVGKRQLVKI